MFSSAFRRTAQRVSRQQARQFSAHPPPEYKGLEKSLRAVFPEDYQVRLCVLRAARPCPPPLPHRRARSRSLSRFALLRALPPLPPHHRLCSRTAALSSASSRW